MGASDDAKARKKAIDQAMKSARKARKQIGEENLQKAADMLQKAAEKNSAEQKPKKARLADEVAADILVAVEESQATRH